MKTKHHSHRGLSRLVAILLCALCVIGLFPMSAFALEPGTKASSWMGDQYLASDCDTYYHPAPWYSMTYHEDVAAVKDSFKKMLENGVYKADLFSDL